MLSNAQLESLYRSSRDDVYAFVARLVGRDAAEDVTATAFERAFKRRDRHDDSRGTPRAWLFGIARNAALDELRRRGPEQSVDEVPEPDQAGESMAEVAVRRATLVRELRELDPSDRELIALRFHGGLSHGDIATVLDITETNAGTQLHRAIGRLRERLNA